MSAKEPSCLEIHPSKSCRFCKKNVTCQGTKVPRVSLFNVVRNKELVAYTGEECFVLADVVSSLGYALIRHENLSEVSCLTCARTLARIYGTFKKLIARGNDGAVRTPVKSSKRVSSNSPTGVSPLAKKTREVREPSTSASSSKSPRRSLALSGDFNRENRVPLAGVCAFFDQVESPI